MRASQTQRLGERGARLGRRLSSQVWKGEGAGGEKERPETCRWNGVWTPNKEPELNLAGEGAPWQAEG